MADCTSLTPVLFLYLFLSFIWACKSERLLFIWVFTDHRGFSRAFGLKTDRILSCFAIFNGELALCCSLFPPQSRPSDQSACVLLHRLTKSHRLYLKIVWIAFIQCEWIAFALLDWNINGHVIRFALLYNIQWFKIEWGWQGNVITCHLYQKTDTLNILFCVVKQQNMLHRAIFSSGSIVGKLVG